MPSSPRADSGRGWKGIWSGLTLAGLLFQTGCYTYAVPTQAEYTPGTRLALALTDRGRADLANQIGTGVQRVEGTLLSNSPEEYVIGVTKVRSIDGSSARWGGERLAINRQQVANVLERRFSRGRTAIAATTTVVAVVAFIATRNLNVFGIGRDDGDDRNPSPNQ